MEINLTIVGHLFSQAPERTWLGKIADCLFPQAPKRDQVWLDLELPDGTYFEAEFPPEFVKSHSSRLMMDDVVKLVGFRECRDVGSSKDPTSGNTIELTPGNIRVFLAIRVGEEQCEVEVPHKTFEDAIVPFFGSV